MSYSVGSTCGTKAVVVYFNNEHKIQSRLLWIEWTNRARNNVICKKNYIISRKIPPIRTTLPNRRSCKFSQETERKSGWQREWGREPERRRMGRSPCCSKEGLNRGAWTVVEDKILTEYIKVHGEGRWRNLPKKAGGLICVEFEKKIKMGCGFIWVFSITMKMASKACSLSICRLEAMWEKLQAALVELSQTRHQERQHITWWRRSHCQASQALGEQVS